MKTEVGSFRLDKEILAKIRKEAESENMSLNSMVNKVLEMHTRWLILGKLGMVPLASGVVIELFKNMSDEDIKKLAKKQVSFVTESLLLLHNEDSIETFLEMALAFCKLSGFPVSMHEKDGQIRITVKHTLGKKYSLYVAEVIAGKIEQLTKKKAEVSSTANTISFSVNV